MNSFNIKTGDIGKVAYATKSSYAYVSMIFKGERNTKSIKAQRILKALKILTDANNALELL